MTQDHRGRKNAHAYGTNPVSKNDHPSDMLARAGSVAGSDFQQSFIDSRGEPASLPTRRRGRSAWAIAILVVIGLAGMGMYGLVRLLRA